MASFMFYFWLNKKIWVCLCIFWCVCMHVCDVLFVIFIFWCVLFWIRIYLCNAVWNSLCRQGWPETQRSTHLCLLIAGIKGMCYHHKSLLGIFIMKMQGSLILELYHFMEVDNRNMELSLLTYIDSHHALYRSFQ